MTGHVHDSEARSLPILRHKDYSASSVFTPESLLREARRQKGLPQVAVPALCVLDPDGDIIRHLRRQGVGPDPTWACYHTELYCFSLAGTTVGAIGCAVGAAFAVLVAEQLFASGCRFLISVTSAGRLAPLHPPPYFVIIERALRDEGTSYHYLPPTEFAHANPALLAQVEGAFGNLPVPVFRGGTWTTDAPYRETQQAIDAMAARGLLAVEMEAAALYAFAAARGKNVLCFAHVTNQMGQTTGDFEKGESNGAEDVFRLLTTCIGRIHVESSVET
jgi:uridine phosphorylase